MLTPIGWIIYRPLIAENDTTLLKERLAAEFEELEAQDRKIYERYNLSQ